MTTFAVFKLVCSIIAMVHGVISIKRRVIPVSSEGTGKVLFNITGWDAIVVGVAMLAFGVVLFLDAIGVVSWIGE